MRVLLVAYYDLKALWQDRWGMSLLLLLPAVLVLLLAFGAAPLLERDHFVEPFAIAVVDQDGSYETRMLVHQLTAAPALARTVTVRQTDLPTAEAMLSNDEIAAALVIPAGFAANMATGKNLPPTVISNPRRPLQSGLIRQLAQSGADLVTAAQSGVVTVLHYVDLAGVTDREYSQWYGRTVTDFTLQSLGRTQLLAMQVESATGVVSALQYYLVALGVVLVLFVGMAGLWNLGGDEAGLLSRYRSLGLAAWQLALARFLVLGALQALQVAVTLALAIPLIQGAWQGNIAMFAGVLLAAMAANAGLLLLVSVAVPDRTTANLVALALLVLLAVTGGCVLPEAYLPPGVQVLSSLTPTHWAVVGLLSAAFGPDVAVVGRSLVALATVAGAALGASSLWFWRSGR